VPHSIGYDFAGHDGVHYRAVFWGMNRNLHILSPEKFYKGDPVRVDSVDESGILVSPWPDSTAMPDRALLFVSNPIPLDPKSEYAFYANGCEILVSREAVHHGNKSYLMLVSVPTVGRSNIHGVNERKERFVFSFRGI